MTHHRSASNEEATVPRAVRILAIFTLVALLPSIAAAKWTRLSSANFVFIGDASASQIRRVAEKLEQFREVMTRALPGATSTSPVPTIVVVFATERSLNPVKPLFRGNATDVAGYLQTGEDVNYIAINGEYIDIAMMTVFHEYAHLLVNNTMGSVPAWLGEGLAEFYAMMEGLDGGKSAVIGRAPVHHVELLKGSTLIPTRELLSIDHSSQVYNEGSRRGVFYAQSWALTHYLTLGNKERATQFRQYLTAVRSGVEHQRAFADAFGADSSVLDRELFDYVRKYLFPALRLQFTEKIVAATERGTTLEDVEGETHVADLQARIGREEEARTRLKAIVTRKPDAALAWTSLGLIEFRERRIKEALPLLERGVERGQGNAFVQSALGRALIAAFNEETASDREMEWLQKARVPLAKAVELDANSSFAAGMLGYVELALGGDLPRAVSLLETAVRLAPSREQYRLMLAQALMRQRDYTRATNHLGTLMATGRTADIRDDARRLLSEVANARVREAAGTTTTTTTTTDRERRVPLGSVTGAAPPARRSTVRLDLRVVQSGETRVLGQFRAIECTRDRIVLQVDANGRTLKLAAKQLSDVDFITYRSDTAGSVSCGPLPTPMRVLITYRVSATTTTAGAIDGDAVAIEVVPDDYTPEAVAR
jgi:tetratricopeptide (TPR) repeat protein